MDGFLNLSSRSRDASTRLEAIEGDGRGLAVRYYAAHTLDYEVVHNRLQTPSGLGYADR